MRSLVPKLLTVAIVLVAAIVWVPAAGAVPTYSGSFKVSAKEANNAKIVAGPDGNVWMTLPGSANDVAKVTPAGVVTEFDLPAITVTGGIAAGPEGKLWVVVNGGAASFLPSNPLGAKEFSISAGIKPNASIVSGPENRMWIATEGLLLSFPPAEAEAVKSEFGITGLNPHDIDVAGPRLVIADSAKGRIVTFEPGALPKTGEVEFVRNPTGTAQGVAGNPSGQIAFSESDGEEGLALASPPSPATSTLLKVGDPFGVALGPDGAYYFAMSADDDVRRLTPAGELSTITGFPAKFFPRQITGGPANTVWVMMEIPGAEIVEVARISGVELPPTPPPPPTATNPITVTEKAVPDTRVGKAPKKVVKVASGKATVKFTFSSTIAGSSFQCRLVKAPVGKGKKKKTPIGSFSACGSPKVLKLAPGKYRFAVRAVADGAADPTPAERAFRVLRAPRHK